jgi:hypothetical protein
MGQRKAVIFLWTYNITAVVFLAVPALLLLGTKNHFLSGFSEPTVFLLWRAILIATPIAVITLGLLKRLAGTKPVTMSNYDKELAPLMLTGTALTITAILIWLTWTAFQPPVPHPNISITFVSYDTNNVAGPHTAQVSIVNHDAKSIYAYLPHVETPAPNKPGGVTTHHLNGMSAWHSDIAAHATANITVQVPTNQTSWRLTMYVYPDSASYGGTVRHIFGLSCINLGLMPKYVQLPSDVKSDWIPNIKE